MSAPCTNGAVAAERDALHERDKVIERQAAELDALRAEVARLKTVPMKYRRMEFNAQLQQENAELRAAIDALRGELAVAQHNSDDAHTRCMEYKRKAAELLDDAQQYQWPRDSAGGGK